MTQSDDTARRNVLVTGGNRGIGLAIARAFAESGDQVVITNRKGDAPEGLRAVRCEVTDTDSVNAAFDEAEQILGGPVEVLVANAGITRDTLLMRMSDEEFDEVISTNLAGAFKCARRAKSYCFDVASRGEVETMCARATEDFARIDILVNNAGITRDNLLMRMKDDDWQAILDTNLTSVFRLSKAVMRGMMKARKGRIINIASVIGVTGNAGQANYAAAKAGIIAFSKSLAKEIGSRGVTVNVVAPGFIDTDMTKALPEDAKNAMLGQIALGRFGEPADIARAVAFLAGPSAAYITGETLHVNGGMYMP